MGGRGWGRGGGGEVRLLAHRRLLEAEGVLGLAVGRLVVAEPLAHHRDAAGHHALNVADVVEPRRERVVRGDADHLKQKN